jgi:hypothetical protein
VPKKAQKEELLQIFDFKCCFCGVEIDVLSISQDHLIPMNKAHLGLHAWGNVVPCCGSCNNKKQQRPWKEFLAEISPESVRVGRIQRIESFVTAKQYDPKLNLHQYADNLYEDVGSVALTLIQLRFRQAQSAIEELLGNESGEGQAPNE